MQLKQLVVVSDCEASERLYVNGKMHEIEGDTVFACDIAEAAGSDAIQFTRIDIESHMAGEWPDNLQDVPLHDAT